MSLMYYSRMRIVLQLLPLLLASSRSATVVSVYAAGMEAKLFPDDLSLRDTKAYSYLQARSHMCYMHTLFFEALAQKHPGKLSLVHIFPGLVPGPGFHGPEVPLWFRIIFFWFVMPTVGRWVTVDPTECGERMLSLAGGLYPAAAAAASSDDGPPSGAGAVIPGTDEGPDSGTYCLTWNGESNYPGKKYAVLDKKALRTRVWDHTVRAFEVIEKGVVFTE
jgi:hypothetical protein